MRQTAPINAILVVVLAAALALTARVAPAAAQPTITAPTAATAPTAPVAAARPAPRAKAPRRAIVLSTGVTLASAILVATASPASAVGAVGLVIGPSAGHWYAGSRNLGGIALRTTALVIVAFGALQYDADHGDGDAGLSRNNRQSAGIMLGGLGLLVASTVHDTVTAGRAARRWNDAHALTVAPLVARDTTGLVIAGRF